MEMALSLLAIWLAFSAFVSWHLAAQQGRNARGWAIATVLGCGIPLIWLMINNILPPPPTFGSTARRHTCCDKRSWIDVAELGHAGGCDLDLGWCENCGAYLMAVFYVNSTNYVVLSDERAEHFLRLEGTPQLKKELKSWVD